MIRRLFDLDFIVVGAFVLLLGAGLIALYSIFPYNNGLSPFFVRQSAYVVAALFVAALVGLINYDVLRSYSTALYFITVGALVIVLVFGETVRGTVGWLNLGFVQIQPVEMAKITMIIFLADFIARKRILLGEVMTIFVSFLLMGVVVGLILLQPDTGSALVVVAIWLGMIIVSGIKKRYILGFVVMGLIVCFGAWTVLVPYQRARITTFINPENDPQNTGYNVIQSMIAVGNGGLTGRGIGYGTQSQLNFLPEKHTDFIFAAYTESLGFIGALFLLLLFGVLFVRFYSIAIHARDAFGYFLVVGIVVVIFIHMVVNVGMNMGIMPVTGIPLPFISYGGSAMLSMALAMGIVQSVYRRRKDVLDTHIQESY